MKGNFVRVLLAASAFAAVTTVPVFAATWQETDGKWQYVDANGNAVSARWVHTDTASYYIGDNGFMVTDTLLYINEDYYCVDASGAMVKNEWRQFTDELGESSWYYFGADGKAFRNKTNKLTPKTVGEHKYGFSTDAKMLTGFVGEDGEVLLSTDAYSFLSAKYYFNAEGVMHVSQWLEVSTMLEPDMRSQLGMKDYSNYAQMWMYFDENGKLVKAKDDSKAKVMTINGKDYAFDENGIMMPGFSLNNATVSIVNTATSSNAIRVAEDDMDGALIKNRWTWAVPTNIMDEEEFDDQEYSWWRSDATGKLIKNGIHTVNGRKYAFDKMGRMETGFVIMLENGKFGIQYDMDEWNRADFLHPLSDSVIPGLDRGNLYVFNADEFNDGSLMHSGEFKVVLNDEEVIFGAGTSGRVYGNKGTLQKVKRKYYYNGMRLDANDDLAYGVIDTNTSANVTDYVVVDTEGQIIKGKRVVQDGEGYWIVIQNGKFVARLGDADKPRWYKGRYWRYDSSLKGTARYVSPVVYSVDNIEGDFVVFEH